MEGKGTTMTVRQAVEALCALEEAESGKLMFRIGTAYKLSRWKKALEEVEEAAMERFDALFGKEWEGKPLGESDLATYEAVMGSPVEVPMSKLNDEERRDVLESGATASMKAAESLSLLMENAI